MTFGTGLNVIYGASNTGKSFIVEAIDFMLGGKPPLRDIPERVGYDLVLLGLETLDGKSFTLWRSIDGGGFRLYEDLHQTPPTNEIPYTQLDENTAIRTIRTFHHSCWIYVALVESVFAKIPGTKPSV